MEYTTDVIKNYEELLKNSAQKTPISLYSSENKNRQSSKGGALLNPQDIITNLTSQIKAINSADTLPSKSVKKSFYNCKDWKQSSFVPVNRISKDVVIPQPTHANKFETQFDLDTQLMDVIVNAEELIENKNGITQEFDSTFQVGDKEAQNCINSDSSSPTEEKNGNGNKEVSVPTNNIFPNPSNENIKEKYKNKNDLQESNVDEDMVTDAADDDLPCSYIFKPIKKPNTPSPLVFDLNSFEDFEKIAIPIIEEHPNIKSVKQLINSQIVGRELLIQTHDIPQFCTGDTPLSPVLQMTSDKLNTPKCFESDDDTKNSDHMSVPDLMKDSVFLKDNIIFSSDEESEYIHKHSQDLPLTCALETSFYNQSQVLDKTMYVCFQTASNRSIQVCTESYEQAKSFLDDFNKDKNKVTLTELVEMCDIQKKTDNEIITQVKDFPIKIDLEDIFDDDVDIITKPSSNQKSPNVDEQHNNLKSIESDKLLTIRQLSNLLTAPVKRKYDGDMSESNKEIKLSKQALARCKEVFQNINFKDFGKEKALKLENVATGNIQNEINTHNIDEDILSDFNEEMPLIENKQEEIEQCKITSSKNAEMPEEAFTKSKSIFNEFSNPEANKDIEKKSQYKCLNWDQPTTSKQHVCDFKTASNKEISISCEALATSKVFKDILEDNTDFNTVYDRDSNKFDNLNDYDGFKTANNKAITISEEAFFKTRNMFNNITFCEEDIDTIEEECKKENTDVELELEEVNKLQQELCDDFDDILDDIPIPEDKSIPIFCGFKTASNKSVKVSEKAMCESKKIFADLDLDDDFNYFPEIVTVAHKSKSEDNMKLKEVTNIVKSKTFTNEASAKLFQSEVNSNNFVGFKTASNKEVNISEKALAKSKQLFSYLEFDDLEKEDDTKSLHEESKLSSYNRKNAIPKIQSFQTASRKSIHASEKALEQSKALFKDIEDEDIPKRENPEGCESLDYKGSNNSKEMTYFTSNQATSIKRFKTPSDKSVQISKGALTSIDIIHDNIPNTDQKHFTYTTLDQKSDNEGPTFKGFETANGKPVIISKEALAKSNAMFKDIVNDNTDDSRLCLKRQANDKEPICGGFQTASKKPVKISAESLAKSRALFKDIDNAVDNPKEVLDTNIQSSFKGFQTASKKPVKLSAEALAKSRALLQDIEDVADNPKDLFDMNIQSCFEGFQTASKKPVIISAKSLARSKALFKDIDNVNLDNPKDPLDTNIQSGFKGFQTASKKPVKISAESLANSRALFKDIETDDINNPKEILDTHKQSSFKVLQTASKKPVKISAEALAKSRALFKDIDDAVDNPKEILDTDMQSGGFQTASKKPVKISSEALAKSKALFKDIDNDDLIWVINPQKPLNTNMQSGFKGFQTASKKPVKISAEALAKSRTLFKDIEDVVDNPKEIVDTNIQSGFKGFQTASKKPVKISAESLAKSRAIFNDIDNDDINNPKEVLDTNNESPEEPILRGFASQKPVIVTDTLARRKLLLTDLDDGHALDSASDLHGFTSGNNKGVTSSEDAMEKSRNLFHKRMSNDSEFCGFQTASKKQVLISEDAMKRSLLLFQDIHDENLEAANKLRIIKNEYKNKENCNTNIQKTTFTLKSANNNRIEVSQKALNEKRNLFSEVNNKSDNSLEQLIDTQVINNFDETLYTEDFCKDNTPKYSKSKRSGSPILSCPKPKRRKKFETPYKTEVFTKTNIIPDTEFKMESTYDMAMLFNEDYKKTKRYTLKDLATVEKNIPQSDSKNNFPSFNFDNLLSFKFDKNRNDLSETEMPIEEIKNVFLNNVKKRLVPDGWLDNHIKLIIWKLLSYEVKFPTTLSGVCTVKNVLDQLKYRYDKELYNAERPALRKILEKDDVASKTMVLCVAAVYVDGVSVTSIPSTTSKAELLLTDGWYCVKAAIDNMLTKLVCDGRIRVGCKIVTNGAELVGCEQGVAPWEDTSSVRLKLFGNSTRRARWDARLGYHGSAAILAPLSTVKVEGGKVSKLRLYVARVYPALFVEKFEDGSTVTLSERLETIHQVKYESERQAIMEKLYEEVEKELSDQESQDSESSYNKKSKLYNGSQLILNTQTRSLEERSNKRREELIQNIQTKLQDKMEAHGLNVRRNVIPLLKVRVAGVKKNSTQVTKGLMSLWKPNDAITDIIREGTWIEVLNVVPTAIRYSEIQLSAGRNSIFRESKLKASEKLLPFIKNLKRKCYHIKELTKNPAMTTDYNEIDTVGFIFQIDPKTDEFESSKQPFQNVYLTDGEKNIICVNFWNGLKKFGYHNVLDTGQIVACVNLQKRSGNTKKNIPHYRVTEFSYFTKTPKNIEARNMVEELVKKFSGLDKRKYCEECVVFKNNLNKSVNCNNENISPYRINNIHNLTRNKIFIDSPLAQKPEDENLNLTGLDFESTFKQNTEEQSPDVLLRKKKVNEKIAKLKMYGEPPPLNHIHIINKSKSALNSYKSPLSNVASVKKEGTISRKSDCNIQSSPVLAMNRTFVKTVHPVRLNFSNVQNVTADDMDDFAEEFDASPPLSLD